jgi:hypothetical protein
MMNFARIVGILLIVAGLAGLIFQQFSYTRDAAEAKLGPLELSVKERKTVNIPLWASLAAIGAGVVVIVAGGRRK